MARAACRTLLAVLTVAGWLAGRLEAQPRVGGVVRIPGGAPISAAQVELLPIPPGYVAGRLRLEGREVEGVATAAADEQGRFSLMAPEPGTYRVRVTSQGRVPMRFGPLALVEDQELPPAMLAEDAGLALRFVTSAGRPVEGLWVYAEPSAGAPLAAGSWLPEFRIARTAADGTVSFARAANEPLTVSWFPPSAPPGSRTTAVPATITVARPSGKTAQLRVVDRADRGLPGVLLRMGPEAWPMGWTDEAGSFLLATTPDLPLGLRLTSPGGFTLVVTAAPAARPLEIRFPEVAPVRGRILDAESGRPLPGALVWSPADPGTSTHSDAEGRFEIGSPEAGPFWLEALAAGYLPKRIALSPADRLGGRGPTFALARAQSLRGRVVNPLGTPITEAWISAEPEHPAERPLGRGLEPVSEGGASDRTGAFELRRLRPGAGYRLRAERPGFLPAELSAVAPVRGAPPPLLRVVLRPAPRATGRVADLLGRPVAGAEVRVATARRGRRQTLAPRSLAGATEALRTTTDPRGRFRFPELPGSSLDLEVEKADFAVALFSDLKVPTEGSEVDFGTLILRPGAEVHGRIVGPSGRPVAGAAIHEVRDPTRREALAQALADQEPAAQSGASGEFTLARRPEGVPTNLLIVAEGFRPASVLGVRPPTPEPLVVRLTKAFSLRGRVESVGGEPIAEAEVGFAWQDALPDEEGGLPAGPSLAWKARSDRDGRFTLTGLPRGEGELSIEAGGFVPLEDVPLSLPGPEPGAERTFTLERGNLLEGRVTTSAGHPVAGAKVIAGPLAAVSDDEGFYALTGVPAGPVEIELVHPHYPRQRQRRRLSAGANRLDFEIPAGQEVSGRVLDEQGRPVAGARLRLRAASRLDNRTYRARSNDEGDFRLAPVADGSYVLGASADGYPDASRPAPVVVAGEPLAGLEVTLARGAAVVGRVVGLEQEELWRVEVEARHASGESRAAELDLAGNYALEGLTLGSWQIRARLRGGERQAQVRVDLQQSDGEVRRDLVFGERLRLSGQVFLTGQPFAGARVTLRAEQRSVERAVTTDHAGSFRFQDLEADTYHIGLSHPERPVLHNRLLSLTTDREIVLDLQLVTVGGVVVDAATAEPIAGAIVALEPPPDPETAGFVITSGTDERGTFLLPLVAPGPYRLRGRAEGYSSLELHLEVPAEQGLSGLELALVPTTGLEVAVRLASGEAPPIVHYLALDEANGAALAGSLVPDARGLVRLPTSGSGSWRLSLDAPGGGAADLMAQASGPPLPVMLPPAAPLAVRVPALYSSDERAQVSIVSPEGTPLHAVGLGGSRVESWPIVGGRAIIDDLPAGTWMVYATTADGRRWGGVALATGTAPAAVVLE